VADPLVGVDHVARCVTDELARLEDDQDEIGRRVHNGDRVDVCAIENDREGRTERDAFTSGARVGVCARLEVVRIDLEEVAATTFVGRLGRTEVDGVISERGRRRQQQCDHHHEEGRDPTQ